MKKKTKRGTSLPVITKKLINENDVQAEGNVGKGNNKGNGSSDGSNVQAGWTATCTRFLVIFIKKCIVLFKNNFNHTFIETFFLSFVALL